jgi:hypothetical protein
LLNAASSSLECVAALLAAGAPVEISHVIAAVDLDSFDLALMFLRKRLDLVRAAAEIAIRVNAGAALTALVTELHLPIRNEMLLAAVSCNSDQALAVIIEQGRALGLDLDEDSAMTEAITGHCYKSAEYLAQRGVAVTADHLTAMGDDVLMERAIRTGTVSSDPRRVESLRRHEFQLLGLGAVAAAPDGFREPETPAAALRGVTGNPVDDATRIEHCHMASAAVWEDTNFATLELDEFTSDLGEILGVATDDRKVTALVGMADKFCFSWFFSCTPHAKDFEQVVSAIIAACDAQFGRGKYRYGHDCAAPSVVAEIGAILQRRGVPRFPFGRLPHEQRFIENPFEAVKVSLRQWLDHLDPANLFAVVFDGVAAIMHPAVAVGVSANVLFRSELTQLKGGDQLPREAVAHGALRPGVAVEFTARVPPPVIPASVIRMLKDGFNAGASVDEMAEKTGLLGQSVKWLHTLERFGAGIQPLDFDKAIIKGYLVEDSGVPFLVVANPSDTALLVLDLKDVPQFPLLHRRVRAFGIEQGVVLIATSMGPGDVLHYVVEITPGSGPLVVAYPAYSFPPGFDARGVPRVPWRPGFSWRDEQDPDPPAWLADVLPVNSRPATLPYWPFQMRADKMVLEQRIAVDGRRRATLTFEKAPGRPAKRVIRDSEVPIITPRDPIGYAFFSTASRAPEAEVRVRSFRERHGGRVAQLRQRADFAKLEKKVLSVGALMSPSLKGEHMMAVAFEILVLQADGAAEVSDAVLGRLASVSNHTAANCRRTLGELAPHRFPMIVGVMEAALCKEFRGRRGAWIPFANEIKRRKYTRPEILVALQFRAWRFRDAGVPFPGVAQLAALTGLDEAVVRGVLVRVRNDEAQWALEVNFPGTQAQWGPGLARLRATHREPRFTVVCEIAAANLRGDDVSNRDIAVATGIPEDTVKKHARTVRMDVATVFPRAGSERGAGRPGAGPPG